MLSENDVEEEHRANHIGFSTEWACAYDVKSNVVGNTEINKHMCRFDLDNDLIRWNQLEIELHGTPRQGWWRFMGLC